ncbi:MAG: hypothetical protein J6D29_02265 [Solobacterium sp.]|nr:hypothetical protein [Solobacterium sp.]
MRNYQTWNENWAFEKPGCDKEIVTLPHTWNAKDGQDGGNDYYRGTCVYSKTFPNFDLQNGEEVYVEFRGAAMSATVCVNGKQLTTHEGGYATFRVNITDVLQEENIIEVYVNNEANHVYPQSADFTFYGGLYRDVYLLIVPRVHFELDHYGGNGIKVTPVVNLEEQSAKVKVEAWINQSLENVSFQIGEEIQEVKAENGYACATFMLANVHLWNGLEDPYLYELIAKVQEDEVQVPFGCRTYEINSQQGFVLNGKAYPLRGVSRHQDRLGVGNALTPQMHEEDIALILEVGANSIRLAHYQHDQYFYDLCDRCGLIVWAEIPYITKHMQEGRKNTLLQMQELIIQNYNHPSIVVWGLSNEITAASMVNDALLENHQALNDLAHQLDATRLTTMANVFMLETDSPILDIPDVNAYNLYFGWYLGELTQNEEFFDAWHAQYPDKPIGFSEYGADTNPQFHSVHPERGDYSESFQCVYHEYMLKMIEERPWLWCTYVWNMFDFGADGRDEGGKNGQNQKGLVTMDRKTKKDAFFLYKAHWSKEPFVYITERRYVNRNEQNTKVKVYSNQEKITLFVDGEEFETKEGKYQFEFEVPISNKHAIKAVSGSYEDEITIQYVEEKDMHYVLNQQSDVKNWFDEEIDPAYYSVHDTLGEIAKSPEANAVLEQMMAKMTASRGDVAEDVKNNPNLKRMMARMTLISLIKQAGDVDAASVEQLNRILQTYKKG